LHTYVMNRVVLTVEGSAIAQEPVALWTILETGWPLLAERLRAHPDEVAYLLDPTQMSEDYPKELQDVIKRSDVRDVVTFKHGGPLTEELVRACCGMVTSTAPSRPDQH
jgi:hypothetical protein